MGYRASKKQFKENEFGKWKFATDDDIYKIVGDNDTNLKLAIMADVGRCDYKTDIVDKANSPVDMVRVAAYMHQIPEAIEMILDADKKGYETTCNIMAISNVQASDVQYALDELAKTPVKAVYIVDSYGSLFPIQMRSNRIAVLVFLYLIRLIAAISRVGETLTENRVTHIVYELPVLRIGHFTFVHPKSLYRYVLDRRRPAP